MKCNASVIEQYGGTRVVLTFERVSRIIGWYGASRDAVVWWYGWCRVAGRTGQGHMYLDWILSRLMLLLGRLGSRLMRFGTGNLVL